MKKIFITFLFLFLFSCKKEYSTSKSTHSLKPEVCFVNFLQSNEKKPIKPPPPPPPPPPVDTLPAPTSTDTSTGVLLLDFDGNVVSSPVWNNGNTFTCAPSGLTALQIDQVINIVRNDYVRYKVLVTIDENAYLKASLKKRMRVIITPTSSWYSSVSGISYTGSLSWGDNTPCFVFTDRLGFYPSIIGEICSHELGHTAGLTHQSKYNSSCQLLETYNTGDGTNAPIMGNSMYALNGGSWWVGPTPNGCNTIQNDDKILTASLGLR